MKILVLSGQTTSTPESVVLSLGSSGFSGQLLSHVCGSSYKQNVPASTRKDLQALTVLTQRHWQSFWCQLTKHHHSATKNFSLMIWTSTPAMILLCLKKFTQNKHKKSYFSCGDTVLIDFFAVQWCSESSHVRVCKLAGLKLWSWVIVSSILEQP